MDHNSFAGTWNINLAAHTDTQGKDISTTQIINPIKLTSAEVLRSSVNPKVFQITFELLVSVLQVKQSLHKIKSNTFLSIRGIKSNDSMLFVFLRVKIVLVKFNTAC